MKIKNLLSAVFLAAGLALSLPAAVSPARGTGTAVLTAMAAVDGWNSDANGWYYLSNGARLTGLQTIGTDTYYFDENGYRLTGPVFIDSALYYFNPGSGRLETGIKGLQRIGTSNDYYYFRNAANGTVLVNKWATHNGKRYYAGKDGKIQFGTVMIQSSLYHLTPDGMLTGYAKSSYNGKYYYAGAAGKLKTGLKKINGKYYYFDPLTGERAAGLVSTGGYTYYFAPAKGYAKTGWVKIDDKYYYHGSQGRRKFGLAVINKKTYYLNPKDSGARVSGRWFTVNGNKYYFGSNGAKATGWLKLNGKTYYLGSNGLRATGLQTVGGRKYYFNKNGVMKTGWLTYKKTTYYMNPSSQSSSYGAAVTGWAKISGKTYYFNSDGSQKKGTWLYDSASKAYYYLDKNTGEVLTGKQTIDGKVFDLGSSGAYKPNPSASGGALEIRVNRALNCITVYQGGLPIKAIVCSTAADGVSTPLGTFTLLDKLRWHELNGPSWGQYCSHITWNILFHSVPCKRYQDNHSLNAVEFNKLGQAASGGCIRLTVGDAKWIYDNCPVGTKVVIYDDWKTPGPLGKPTAPKIPNSQNYDPTDPAA